jgi:phosphonate metabolism protein (transferase hexapeptide repeat family)
MKPATAKRLSDVASVHPSAVIKASSLGRYVEIGENVRLTEVDVGDYSYIARDADAIYADIGKFCSIAAATRINPGNHPMWRATQHHFTYRSAQYGLATEDDAHFFQWRRDHHVSIGHDVWLGHGAVILAGVKISTGAVVAAGAVVSKSVPPYTIVGGVPAKPIKRRFPADVAERLIQLAWWDWSHEQIGEALADFRALSVEAFLEKYRSASRTSR